jgi:hypothetical protein
MKFRFVAVLAAAGSLFGLGASGAAAAGNVGYYAPCYGENPAIAIAAAGHTPVHVSTIDAASLAGLDGLVLCQTGRNAALDAAVANGMALIAHDQNHTLGNWLPGTAGFTGIDSAHDNVDFPAGSPVLSGPGGLLDNTTLDHGSSSIHGAINLASIPASAQVLAYGDDPNRVVTLTYAYGAGRVVYSTIPLGCYLQGGGCSSYWGLATVSQGMQRYAANVISWAVGPSFESCAAEGYTGTKLTLCRKICETEQPASTLSALIRFWMASYRTAPGCAY